MTRPRRMLLRLLSVSKALTKTKCTLWTAWITFSLTSFATAADASAHHRSQFPTTSSHRVEPLEPLLFPSTSLL
ncbi:hypothetical protein ARMSODRAFT_604494 [Armillaria solidipes]|uniref:Uncharacterized protein n=1 Tax=Armillaria solidipes TaxID=1076256 RepID=A0A2H3AUM5_9AGAR|nr:hypothetical protein ARMSODRAFT_604494 [Armillaria solidipes]